MKLRLHPDWYMRPEYGYTVMCKVTDAVDDVEFITPQDAVVLTFFNGQMTVEEVIEAVAFVVPCSRESAQEIVDWVINRYDECLIEDNGALPKRIYDPLRFATFPGGSGTKRLRAPLNLTLSLTNACATECTYCAIDRQRYGESGQPLTLSRWKEIIHEAKQLEVMHFGIGGIGDPMMYRDIFPFLECIVETEIPYHISTKVRLTENQAKRLVDIGIKEIQISLDAADEYLNTLLIQTSRRYRAQMTRTIGYLTKHNVEVNINSVVTGVNVRDIPNLIELADSLEVASINMAEAVPTVYNAAPELLLSEEDREYLSVTVPQLREQYRHLPIYWNNNTEHVGAYIPWDDHTKRKEAYAHRSGCTAGTRQMVIYQDGNVTGCDQSPTISGRILGNLTHQSILEVWNSEHLMSIIRPTRSALAGQICEDCLDFYACHSDTGRCYIEAARTYGSFHAPVPQCPKAPEYHLSALPTLGPGALSQEEAMSGCGSCHGGTDDLIASGDNLIASEQFNIL